MCVYLHSGTYKIPFPRVCRKTDSNDGKRNLYPILRRRIGTTRELDKIAALANSFPNIDFNIKLGIEKIVGRDKIFPNVFVKSEFVTGLGETAFTGPLIDSSTIAYIIRASKSSIPIQLIY